MTFIIEEKTQNINNNVIANLESYFQTTIEYLDKFKWVYDFQTTQLFTTKLFTHQFKQEVNISFKIKILLILIIF